MAVLMMAFMSIGFASCSSDDDSQKDEEESAIVGTWSSEESAYDQDYEIITLKSDGTGRIVEIDQGRKHKPYDFEYVYSKGKLTIIYEDDTDVFEVMSLSKSTLRIKDLDGDIIKFTKQ